MQFSLSPDDQPELANRTDLRFNAYSKIELHLGNYKAAVKGPPKNE